MIIAATGHRPDKLGGYEYDARRKLERFALDRLFRARATKVISGMAQGWDQAIAMAAVELRIPFIAAVPFKGQELQWPEESQERYINLLTEAESIVYVCDEGYASWKMLARNEWMVDHGESVLALWNRTPGGTGNCVIYAKTKGVEVVNVWNEWERWEDARTAADGS